MIKFLEFSEKSGEFGKPDNPFIEGLNKFICENLGEYDTLLSVSYRKFLEDGKPSSSVWLTIDTDERRKPIKDRMLYFYELNENELSKTQLTETPFAKIVSEQLSSVLQKEDDLLSVEYQKFFLNGHVYSSVLMLLNIKN